MTMFFGDTRPRWAKPEATLPGVVAVELLLARTDTAAIAVTGIRAFPTGFEFTLSCVTRTDDGSAERMLFLTMRERPLIADAPIPDDLLAFGIQYADGRVAADTGTSLSLPDDADPVGPLALPQGGGGGGRHAQMTYWVWSLPPAGPVTFVCQWLAHGIGETRGEIDGKLIRDAAARSVQLWPED